MSAARLTAGNSYDAESKIWNGPIQENFYAKNLSIGAIIYEEMRRHPTDIGQISATEHTVLTKGELLENSIRVATYLNNLGVGQHDIVGIIARNTTHMSAVAYACFFNGTAFHSLNSNYEISTIQQLFSITEPKVIFCDGEDYPKVREATESLNTTIYTMKDHIEGVPTILDILQTPLNDEFRPAKLDKGIDQTLAILCSSGTTGTPKAVTISNSHKIFEHWSYLNASDIQLCISSLDWLTGLFALITTAIYGTQRIIIDQAYDPAKFLQIINDYEVTWVFQAPSHLGMLLNVKQLTPEKMDSVRYFQHGGGKCSLQTLEKLQAHLRNGEIFTMYGFTEAGTAVSQNIFSENQTSVGRLFANFKAKVINDDGVQLGPEEQGEICIYHDQHWNGYYRNEAETKKMRDSEGWFHTGDLGYFDKDNNFYITDRKKDMLKYQGIMYYPNELEEVISQMPEVAEVCVFGVWNQIDGDAAGAVVVKSVNSELSAQDVIDYVTRNVVAKYKQLHAGVLILEELKRSPNGKINRNANKAHFLDIINGN